MKNTIHFKLTAAIVIAIIPLFYLANYFITQNAIYNLRQALCAQVTNIAAVSALTVNAEQVLGLNEINDEKTLDYTQLVTVLNSIKNTNPRIRNIYTLRKSDKPYVLKYSADTSQTQDTNGNGIIDSWEEKNHCGDEYDIAYFPEMQAAFNAPIADREISRDADGYWISGYAPLKNKQGESIAIIGVEFSAKDIIEQEKLLYKIANLSVFFAIMLCIIIGSLLSYNFTRPIIELIKATNRLVKGDFTYNISIKRADEIGDLGKNFNRMVKNLRQRFQELSALYDVSRGLAAVTDLDNLLNKILDTAIKLLDAEKGSIMLIDPKTNNLEIKAARGLDTSIIKTTHRKIGEGISGWVAKENSPLLITAKSANTLPISFIQKENIKDAITVPLNIQGGVIGVLNISDKKGTESFSWENLNLLSTLAGDISMIIENARLYKKIHDDFLNTIYALAEAVDARDPYTKGHSERATIDALKIARKLNFDSLQIENLQIAAILHDIGKIAIPDNILLKQSGLNAEEYELIKKHPERGIKILQPVTLPQEIIDGVLYHHERYDGTGYPSRLVGTNIPLFARIIAIADCFEAMTSQRPYNKAKTTPEALEEIMRFSGKQFDPQLAKIYHDIKTLEVS